MDLMDELLEELPDFKEEEDKDPQKLQKEKERIGGQDLETTAADRHDDCQEDHLKDH